VLGYIPSKRRLTPQLLLLSILVHSHTERKNDMEPDGKTRVYITGGGEPSAWEGYPINRPYDEALKSDAAQAVLNRARFHAVTCGNNIWGVKVPGQDDFVDLDMRRVAYNERYAALARFVEERTGQTGLTILVS
jgi:hypothetical protein